jgi:hypothetical protein
VNAIRSVATWQVNVFTPSYGNRRFFNVQGAETYPVPHLSG